MTTTTNSYPDVPLPPDAHVLGDWDEWDGRCRIITTDRQEIDEAKMGVSVTAVQFPDGSIDTSPDDSPTVYVDRRLMLRGKYEWGDCLTLSAVGARALARALTEAADYIDTQLGTTEGQR